MALPFANLIEEGLSTAFGFAVGGATQALLLPAIQPLLDEAWSVAVDAGDGVPLDAQTAAMAQIRSGANGYDGTGEVAKSGTTPDRFRLILESMRTPPATSQALDLWNRGAISETEVKDMLSRGGMSTRDIDSYLQLGKQLLSVSDLAMARQQGFIDDNELEARAAQVGYGPDEAQLFFKMAGLPPGITVGIELLRRGLIDEARFAEYVAEGHTKTKYTQDLLNLKYTPLSAATAVEAAIRERVPYSQAESLAAEQGVSPENFKVWYDTVGRAMGIMEALTLLNRGVITESDFREVVARSDVRTEYTNWLLELRTHYPSLFQMEAMIKAGSITDEKAREIFSKEGYPSELIDGMIAASHSAKTAKTKDISLAMVESLYLAGLETHEQATKAIEALGYDAQETEQLLELMSARRIVSEMIHGATLIRTKYIGWKIERSTAMQELGYFLPELSNRERLLKMWDAEREANRPTLTRAQVAQARKYQILKPDEAVARWQKMGYSLEDAQIMDEIVAKGPEQPLPA